MQIYDRGEASRLLQSTHAIRGLLFATVVLIGAAGMTRTAQALDVGTLIQFQPNTTALAADVNSNLDDIRTAVNSKQDEATVPGIDFVSSAGATSLSDGPRSTIATVNLTVPGPGVIEVSFSAQTFINHVLDLTPFAGVGLNCRIERDGTQFSTSLRSWNVVGAEPTGGRNRPLSINLAFSQATAGTIAITATCTGSGTNLATVSRPALAVRFFEQRY